MIFQIFSQNKYKRKRENHYHVTLKPLKGGRANGFESSRSLNNRFCDLGRKSGFGPKLRETERTFSLQTYQPSPARQQRTLTTHQQRRVFFIFIFFKIVFYRNIFSVLQFTGIFNSQQR